MSFALTELQALIGREYENLVSALGLNALPLDIYEVDENGAGRTTAHGTDVRNDTPGYSPALVVLPQLDGDLAAWTAIQPPFPPGSNWDRHRDEWPTWRTDLWHEVVHQYQEQIVENWDPKDGSGGHTKGWPDALDAVANKFQINRDQLLGVL